MLTQSHPIVKSDKNGIIQFAYDESKSIHKNWFGYIEGENGEDDFFYISDIIPGELENWPYVSDLHEKQVFYDLVDDESNYKAVIKKIIP
jgi:hypothetical protein